MPNFRIIDSHKLALMKSQLLRISVINVGFALIASLSGNTPAIANPDSAQFHAQLTPVNSLASSLTLAQLQNATYQIPLLGKVTLNNGTYQSQTQPTVVVTMSKKFVTGNFNQDSATDAMTVLRVTEAGRKPTFYLAAVANQNGQPNNVDTISLGQGFGVKSVTLKGSQVTVRLLKYSPSDAPCCPSDEISQTYWFNPSSGELLATSFSLQDPNPRGIPVQDVPNPTINSEINNNLPDSPSTAEIQF